MGSRLKCRFGDLAKEERMGTVERDRERTEESQVSPKSISNKVNFRDDILSPRYSIPPPLIMHEEDLAHACAVHPGSSFHREA